MGYNSFSALGKPLINFPMQRMLFIKASHDVCATEVEHIQKICEMFNIQHCAIELDDLATFSNQVGPLGKFDFLYLGAHADVSGFGEANSAVYFDWESFAITLCSADCLCPESILLLACCRGGLRMVAMKLFYSCAKIDYLTGPRWTVTPQDITTAFHVFLYNMVIRREQPSTAAKRASEATGYDFYYYDRVETEDIIYTAAMEEHLKSERSTSVTEMSYDVANSLTDLNSP
jgi:hypothetical protein